MCKVITEQQKREIENLADEHHDALIGFGADMYQRGVINGAIMVIAGMVTVITVSKIVKVIKRKKSQQTEEESQ